MALVYCPFCAEPVDIWVDEGGDPSQAYVEDCSVCCHPMRLVISRQSDGEFHVEAYRE